MYTKKHQITRGLVIGKFAPLHKGHQYLIERALKDMDQVYVLIYDSREVTDIPLHIRADWIRTLYPSVIVIEGWGGPTETGKEKWIEKLQEDYVKKVLPTPVTHFYSSEWYGKHMSKALNAINVVVDEKRIKFPISGTEIRKDPHKNAQFLHPYVYKDFVKKVVFMGSESTGKTTIAHKAAKTFHTSWMHEHGRNYWLKNKNESGTLSEKQLADLAQEHIALENKALLKAHHYCFIDTNAITTEMYSKNYHHNKVDPQLRKLASLAQERYDEWFLCDTDIPYDDDGTRGGEKFRKAFQKKIIRDLDSRGIHYTVLSGTLDERLAQIRRVLH